MDRIMDDLAFHLLAVRLPQRRDMNELTNARNNRHVRIISSCDTERQLKERQYQFSEFDPARTVNYR